MREREGRERGAYRGTWRAGEGEGRRGRELMTRGVWVGYKGRGEGEEKVSEGGSVVLCSCREDLPPSVE